MQSAFLSGIYKRYGDLEGGQIVIYFARNLHLNVMRKREEDLDFDLSLINSGLIIKIQSQDKLKIISVFTVYWITKRKLLDEKLYN